MYPPSNDLRSQVRVKLATANVSAFHEYFDGESLGAALSILLELLNDEYEREPAALNDVLDRMYERLQT